MKAVGIICEFNPMHQGHKNLLDYARGHGEAVVCAMAGPFVQRGRPALVEKWTRARIAVEEGADLVVEIPAYFVLQAADFFALGGLSTLSLLPSVQALAFGVEEGFEKTLPDLAEELSQRDEEIQALIAAGLSQRRAINQLSGIDLPANATLALSYLKVVQKLGLPWELLPLARVSQHHDERLDPLHPTGSALRACLLDRKKALADQEKRILFSCLCGSTQDKEKILSLGRDSLDPLTRPVQLFSLLDKLNWTASPSYETGMENRLLASLDQALDEGKGMDLALRLAANKRQSIARYSRLLLSTLLDMKKGAFQTVPYLRVLAMNAKGAALLREVQAPVIQKVSHGPLNAQAAALFHLDQQAQALHSFINGFDRKVDYQQKYMIR